MLRQIEDLRRQIEETCGRQGEGLTSEKVLTLSRKLDGLINSYLVQKGFVTPRRPGSGGAESGTGP